MEQGWTREKGVGLPPRRDRRSFFTRYVLFTRIVVDFSHCLDFLFSRVRVHAFVDVPRLPLAYSTKETNAFIVIELLCNKLLTTVGNMATKLGLNNNKINSVLTLHTVKEQ